MLLICLVALFLIGVLVTYKLFNKDIVHPSIIYTVVYFISTACALYNINTWGIDFKFATFCILVGGSIEFVLIGYLLKRFYDKKCAGEIAEKEQTEFKVNKIGVLIICSIAVINIAMQIYFVIDVANVYGGFTTFNAALTTYKEHTSYSADYELPHFYNLFCKILEMSAYVYIYIFAKTVLDFKKSDFKNLKKILSACIYLVPIVLFVVKELLSSSRITILSIVCAVITVLMIVWNQRNRWGKTVKKKTIAIIIAVGCIGMGLFYASAALIGRVNTKGPLEYVTFYAGGSIECLNQYVINPPEKTDVPGGETFYNLLVGLDKYGITHFDVKSKMSAHCEFRYYNDTMVGNVYTAYRRWLNDFGVIGIILLNGIMSLAVHMFYYGFRYNGFKKFNDIALIIYGYISWSVYLHCIDSYFYTSIVQITFATNIVIMVLIWMCSLKLHRRGKQ